jgi:hypothetical protein
MSTTNTARNLERFTIDVDQDILVDLPARLKATRFAPDLDDDEVYGLSARSIRPLVQYWADGDPRRISAHWKAQRSLLPDVIRRPATLAVAAAPGPPRRVPSPARQAAQHLRPRPGPRGTGPAAGHCGPRPHDEQHRLRVSGPQRHLHRRRAGHL